MALLLLFFHFFFFNDTATTEIYTLSLHDALPIAAAGVAPLRLHDLRHTCASLAIARSEEHTSELQSPMYLVCRLLLEKKNKNDDHIDLIKRKYSTQP